MINSLYVHIPFCIKKCLYCDFNSYPLLDLQDDYIDSLLKEIANIKQEKFKTIFIGGGTPTVLSIKNLEKILKSLSKFKAEEFSIEANPGTIDEEKLKVIKGFGANRISIGLQAFQDRLLRKLGRIHTLDDFLMSYELARKAGFKNINVDVMFDIPDQTLDDFSETINNVIKLNPEHVSCYSLIIEKGTPYYEMDKKGELRIPDEDTDRLMYYTACEKLESNGYKQYEISNFAKEGNECRHNETYWLDEEYLGVGAGAHSYSESKRYFNVYGINDYIKKINNNGYAFNKEEIETIGKDDEMSEFMFMGLRMTEGISKKRFFNRFGIDIYDIYKDELKELIRRQLLLDKNGYIKLTIRGIDISNQVFVYFIR